ncbi:threonine/homoserine efflux transporter RhtA [Mumia flava]|uniref:Threonine/homoserine efflux transporter RhtA n=1 Tax=Mumia flava TaxID=1348852 RepID=A0A0B2BUW0_9ACTN|nr:DMT family transporter [Mumia flava]PJJ58045.1 threonine/homoserine efflux transporter RhtA [Mumia flava]
MSAAEGGTASSGSTPGGGRLAQGGPARVDLTILAGAVLCASTAPPLTAAIAAPALAIAFWRNAMALPVSIPMAWWYERGGLRGLSPRVALLVGFAAVMLALHFASLAAALDRTSVASAATLVCGQSVWAALFAGALGERLSPLGWVGTALALAGVVAVTGVDAVVSEGTLTGNLLALLSGVAGGAYMVSGGVARQHVSASLYTALCYSACAAVLLGAAVLTGTALTGFGPATWIGLAALTLLAQLLGHSLFNFVMRSVSPSLVSLSQLMTVPIASVIAAVALDQTPPPALLPAIGLMVVGIGLVVTSHRRRAVRLVADES